MRRYLTNLQYRQHGIHPGIACAKTLPATSIYHSFRKYGSDEMALGAATIEEGMDLRLKSMHELRNL